jgi:hypothetical protein
MTNLQEIARKIVLLQQYTDKTGVKTIRSQSDLLKDLDGAQTVAVLEMAIAAEKAGRDGKQ